MPGAKRSPFENDEHRVEWVDPERQNRERAQSDERFDRVAFAMRLLRLVRPKGMTVVVHESYRGVTVERGRDYGRPGNASWVMLGISPHASREWIALAVAEIASLERTPFIVDLLVRAVDSSL